jgi:hypothetical protein
MFIIPLGQANNTENDEAPETVNGGKLSSKLSEVLKTVLVAKRVVVICGRYYKDF